MRDYINIGPSPCDEGCVQVGANNYQSESTRECARFILQLRRVFGPEPKGALLEIKSFDHDFGAYREVVCWYDDTLPESGEYAFNIEANTPENWDEEALKDSK